MSAGHHVAMPPEIRKWLTGRCYDFALALLERFPEGELVAFGSERWSDHVGVFSGGLYPLFLAVKTRSFRAGMEARAA